MTTVYLLNLYIKILVLLKIKNKSKLFNIKKISHKHFEVNTKERVINIAVGYGCLNLSCGLKWRISLFIKFYGVDFFIKVLNIIFIDKLIF